MLMRTKRESGQGQIVQYIKAVIVFFAAVLCSMFVLFCGIRKETDRNVEVTISKNVENQSRYFQSILEIQYRYLEGIAGQIGSSEKLFSQENMDLISSVQKTTKLERISIINQDGTAHYDNGSIKMVQGRRYFLEGMSGQRTLSDPLESRLDGETRVVLGVPIRRDDTVVGVLGGSYDVTELSRMLFGDIYDGKGVSFLLTSDGTVVSDDKKEDFGEGEKNIFRYYETLYGSSETIKKFEEDIRSGTLGYIRLAMDGEIRHVAYEPLEFNQWMVCYMVPEEAAKEAYRFVEEYEMALGIVFVGLVLCLFGAFIRISYRRQRELTALANTDVLTGLCNKQSTEKQAERWLSELEKEEPVVQAFLIMDIDYFKNISDQYGHAVGDKVLQQVGSCIRKNFRTTDIMGRIGGDEFVVFMKNIGSMELAERKARELSEQIHKLHIKELDGTEITTSIGLSCYPEHGTTWMELYQHADLALYETKRRGRNGYTVYIGEEE